MYNVYMYMCTLYIIPNVHIMCSVVNVYAYCTPGTHTLTGAKHTHTRNARRYTILITLLNSGVPCTSCGMRFKSESAEEYRRHLDWHYQINRQEKEGTGKTSRNWYMHPEVSNVHKSFGNL